MTAKQQKRRSSVHGPGRGTPRTPSSCGRGGVAATALAFLAALLLAPGEARAADECGAISSTARTVTCSATTYADGIIYQNAAPGANNVATVVVPGGSTAWMVTSGAGATRASNGITLDSDGAAGGGLALTVGSTGGNVVNIRQRASNANSGTEENNGILIIQERTGASTTTATVHAGVTIGQPVGTGTGRMNRHGILARVTAGSGAATFTNHAAIHSTLEGISVLRTSNAGTTAATTIDNHGAINSGAEGIYLNYLAATSNAHTGGATINNHGAITTSGAGQNGILMEYKNRGAAEITNSGAITATQSNSNGILLQHTGAAGGATVTNSGDITSHAPAISILTTVKTAAGSNAGASVIHSGGDIDVSHQAGILVTVGEEGETIANAGDAEITVRGGSVEARDEALFARNRQAGNVVIKVSEGVTLTSRAEEGIIGDLPASNEKGGVTITNAAAITAAKVGILVRRTAPANAGIISITNRGAIKRTGDGVDFDGIRVEDDKGKGHVTVTNSGDIGEVGAMAMYRHGIQVQKTGSSGDLSVTTTGGSITAKDRGIYVTDNADHTGAVTISNGGDITADRPIYVNRNGAGPVTITNTGGTVRTESSHAIFAYNKTGDASDVRVNVEGGTVQSSLSALTLDRVNVVHAFNRGAGDVIVDVAAGTTLISRVSEAVYANLDSTTLAPDNQVKITQGGRMMGRTGVYARAGGYSVAAEGEDVAARAEEKPDVIDVTWTGSFSHGTTEAEKAMVAQNDEDRFSAPNVSRLVFSAQIIEAEAERATDGLYGSAAGVEAQVMSRSDVIRAVAAGDALGEFPDAAAQTALLEETGDASRRTAILAQFRAMLGNEEIDAAAVLTAIDSTATTVADLSDEEIVEYLGADTQGARRNLYNVLFGLSEAEKKVLKAVATGGDVDAALRAAGFTDDADDDEDYWSTVMALLDRYNPGGIRVAMNGGSIDSRGDGIRAYYATPHANNGAINVSVAEGAKVTGANAGIYVANAGLDAGEAGTADDILKQTVTVNGMVTGGADAAVHLVGGGRLTVGEMGVLVAGAGRPAILVNDPGRSVVTILGEVRGSEGADAAVDLSGGGSVTIGEMGRVNTNDGGAASWLKVSGGTYQVAIYTPDLSSRDGWNKAKARVNGGIDTGEEGAFTDREGAADRVSLALVETVGDYTTGTYEPLALNDDGDLDLEGNARYAMLPACPSGYEPLDGGGCREIPPEVPDEEGGPAVPPAREVDIRRDMTGRSEVYEALPSVLLLANDVLRPMPELTSAAQDGRLGWAARRLLHRLAGGDGTSAVGRAGWAQVEVGGGKWKAAASTRPDVAYDYRRHGLRAGMDFALGDDARVGVSFHGLEASVKMAQADEVDLSGYGLGVHGAATFDGGFHVGAQAAVTRYDAELESAFPGFGGVLKKGVDGRGFALGVEAGRRMALGEGVSVTPRAGLTWAKAGLDDFTDEPGTMRPWSVSVEDATSLKGRVGASVEKLQGDDMDGTRLFGSADVEQEFKEETEVKVQGSPLSLKSEAEKTGFRLAVGGARIWAEGRYSIQGSVGYTARGSDNHDVGGGVRFSMRF